MGGERGEGEGERGEGEGEWERGEERGEKGEVNGYEMVHTANRNHSRELTSSSVVLRSHHKPL